MHGSGYKMGKINEREEEEESDKEEEEERKEKENDDDDEKETDEKKEEDIARANRRWHFCIGYIREREMSKISTRALVRVFKVGA